MGVSRHKGFNRTFGRGDKKGFIKRKTQGIGPLINCGLIALNTPETDVTPGQTRPARQALQGIGDGVTYINTGIVPNQNTALRWWGNYKSLSSPSTVQKMGARTAFAVDDFAIGINSNMWNIVWGTNNFSGGTADLLRHKFELKNGQLFVDNFLIGGGEGDPIGNPTFPIWLFAENNAGNTTGNMNVNIEYAEIDHNGFTYAIDPTYRTSTGKFPLTTEVGNTPLYALQVNPPATPTEVITSRESLADKQGYTISRALGNQLYNKDNVRNTLVDHTNGTESSNINFRTCTVLLTESEDFVKTLGIATNRFALYDKNMVYISGGISDSFTKPTNSVYANVCYGVLEFENAMLNEGLTLLPFESYLGYTEDAAGLIPIAQGDIIPNFLNSNVSIGFVNGVHPTAQYANQIKYNKRVVDGVVDNGVDNVNWDNPLTANDITINENGLFFEGAGVTSRARLPVKLKPNTDYTLVVDIIQNSISVSGGFRILGFESIIRVLPTLFTGEYRITFTTDSDITGEVLTAEIRSTALAGETLNLNNYRIYEGDFTTGELPTSGSWQSENSIILNQLYNGVISRDPNNILTENGENKLVTFNELVNISYRQLFVTLDKQKMFFYDQMLAVGSQCLVRAYLAAGLVVPAFDVNGLPLFDNNGLREYVFKDGVTHIGL